MTEREALKLALEALEYRGVGSWRKKQPAITAIKQVLANEALERKAENARELGLDYEPEPVAWRTKVDHIMFTSKRKDVLPLGGDLEPLYTTPPHLKPVAWGVFEGKLHDMFFTKAEAVEMAQLKGTHAEVKPLYTKEQL